MDFLKFCLKPANHDPKICKYFHIVQNQLNVFWRTHTWQCYTSEWLLSSQYIMKDYLSPSRRKDFNEGQNTHVEAATLIVSNSLLDLAVHKINFVLCTSIYVLFIKIIICLYWALGERK